MTCFNRRRRYYKRCQNIVDYLHEQTGNGVFVHESDCIRKFGDSDYGAFLNELKLMGISTDHREATPAMEWMYHSQYFTYKASQERKDLIIFGISVLSLVISIVSLFFSFK